MIKINKVKVTDFQQKVYDACLTIPPGKVATYAWIARKIECRSPRAVGQALRVNPFAPDIPCHRVVRADRTLGGFHGQTEGPQLLRKRNLLVEEGVRFEDTGKVSLQSCLHLTAQPQS